MKKILTYLTSSQTRVFPDSEKEYDYSSATVCADEPLNITLAYKLAESERLPVSVSAECTEYPQASISVYKVGYVPLSHAKSSFPEVHTENRGPGLYPDILYPRSTVPVIKSGNDKSRLPFYEAEENNLLFAVNDAYRSVLICFNENGETLPEGNYTVKISIRSLEDGSILESHNFSVKVLGTSLSKKTFMYTNWFHYDCLADIHGEEVYSDKYFKILKSYLSNAAKNGMNTLLFPAFTPALDTEIGDERKTVQLLIIKKDGSRYTFDFSLMEKFIILALECGIEYFEHAPLFTQWGAKHAPNIYADCDGETKRIFGWDTPSDGEEYKAFLCEYIPAFLRFSEKLGIRDRLFFHVSDEPTFENLPTYSKAAELAFSLIEESKSGDALSDPYFCREGYVKTPIVSISEADSFFGKCDGMWLYYTGGYYDGCNLEKCANRLLTTKPYRACVLGLHLFRYKAAGFLHWGYNYCYDRLSKGVFDPRTNPCGYYQKPGASFLAYPGVGGVLGSLREKYMSEAINDFRALSALEEKIGYDAVMDICRSFFGCEIDCFTIPESAEQMLAFRRLIRDRLG